MCLLFLDSKEKNMCSFLSTGFERKTRCGVFPGFEREKRNKCCVSLDSGFVFSVLES